MRHSPRTRRVLALVVAALVVTGGSTLSATAASAAPPTITKMAALGDSITQATMTCNALLACPANSWSTGSAAAVNSHASRLKASGSKNLVTYNDAVIAVGASALPAQATKAVGQGAQYITVLIGANDACAKSVAAMTPTATFEANVRTALSTLSGRKIFVASIPNLKLMYDLNKGSLSARLAWALLGTCQSLLANPTSTKAADTQRRTAVMTRVNEYNAALQRACAATTGCRFDNYAVANTVFVKSDISTKDYFHPSATGQAKLAQITWAATGW